MSPLTFTEASGAAGADILILWGSGEHGDILGHSSGSMTGDYTHASPEAKEEAMELVANYDGERRRVTTKWRDKIAG